MQQDRLEMRVNQPQFSWQQIWDRVVTDLEDYAASLGEG